MTKSPIPVGLEIEKHHDHIRIAERNLFGAILYDEATDSFTLREYPKYGAGGERRFSFAGAAPRH